MIETVVLYFSGIGHYCTTRVSYIGQRTATKKETKLENRRKYTRVSALHRKSSPRSARLTKILQVILMALQLATVLALANEFIEAAVYVAGKIQS